MGIRFSIQFYKDSRSVIFKLFPTRPPFQKYFINAPLSINIFKNETKKIINQEINNKKNS